MKIKMCMAMLVLACSASLMAQSSMSSDSMKKTDAMGKKATMTGCISEKDGKYMITDKKHPDGVELMSSEDMKPHVGHKVTVTGMMEAHDAMAAGDSMGKDSMAKDDGMKKDSMAMSGFKVTSMKMVSDQCAMGDSMMKK